MKARSDMPQTKKRKPRRRKDARPAEILAAGIKEFAQFGFERARLDRIAEVAGISKGTIYLYYTSKEALFLAAVEEHIITVMAENETVLEDFEGTTRSEEHTSELQSPVPISYAVFCLKKKILYKKHNNYNTNNIHRCH